MFLPVFGFRITEIISALAVPPPDNLYLHDSTFRSDLIAIYTPPPFRLNLFGEFKSGGCDLIDLSLLKTL